METSSENFLEKHHTELEIPALNGSSVHFRHFSITDGEELNRIPAE
jgi:hypothetical protein